MEMSVWAWALIALFALAYIVGKFARKKNTSELEAFYEQAEMSLADIERLAGKGNKAGQGVLKPFLKKITGAGEARSAQTSLKPTLKPPSQPLASIMDEVHTLVTEGRKVEAIRRYREITRCSLAVAKDKVELMAENLPLLAASESYSETPQANVGNEIVALVRAGRKLEAIKMYCTQTGVSLKEGKEAIDKIARMPSA